MHQKYLETYMISIFYRSALLLFLVLFLVLQIGCESSEDEENSTSSTIRDHVEWLADADRKGRLAGSMEEAAAANYIADHFQLVGLVPAGDDNTFIQQFRLEGPIPQAMEMENHISRNVAGFLEGNEQSDQYIIIGAHYDSQGMGGMISMETDEVPVIHNGADDNASGTAGIMHLARWFSENRPYKNILFIAFSGEEMGLLGSRHFTEQMRIDTSQILAMINLDMIGRLSNQNLTIFGTETSNRWNEILDGIENDSLKITRTPSGSGASDHVPFYEAGIPTLHYFTGIHSDYHRPDDTAEKINYTGMDKVLDHIKQLVQQLDQMDASEIEYSESTNPHSTTFDFDGPVLGVIPDYNHSGPGFRLDEVRENEPAHRAGVQAGDVIIKMGEAPIADIYDYMENLEDYEKEDQVVITVRRGGEIIELTVIF